MVKGKILEESHWYHEAKDEFVESGRLSAEGTIPTLSAAMFSRWQANGNKL